MRVGEAGGCLWSRSVTCGSHALATSLPRDTGVFDKVEHWAGQVRSIDGEITELNQNLSAPKARLKFVRHRLRQKVIGRPGPRRRTCSSCEPNDASGTAVVTHSTRTPPGTTAPPVSAVPIKVPKTRRQSTPPLPPPPWQLAVPALRRKCTWKHRLHVSTPLRMAHGRRESERRPLCARGASARKCRVPRLPM